MEFGSGGKYWPLPTAHSITLAAPYVGGWLYFRRDGGIWSDEETEPKRPPGRGILLWCGHGEAPWKNAGYDAGFCLGDFLLAAGSVEDTHPQTTSKAQRADAAWALYAAMSLLEQYRRAGPYETVMLGEMSSEICDEIRSEAAGIIAGYTLPCERDECYRLTKNLSPYALYVPGFRGYASSPESIKSVCAEAGRKIVGDYALPSFEPYEGPLLEEAFMYKVEALVLESLVDRIHFREQELEINKAFPRESLCWGTGDLLRAAYTRLVLGPRRAES